jgi:NAD(P)-dependent dehydrogenase (short-subunit alcohol dehydrogenase family)
VNVIAPSLVDTPLAARLLNNEKKRENMAERHPLKRVGTPADIARMAAFLLSDDSSWMTGQVLGVDGGISSLNIS